MKLPDNHMSNQYLRRSNNTLNFLPTSHSLPHPSRTGQREMVTCSLTDFYGLVIFFCPCFKTSNFFSWK